MRIGIYNLEPRFTNLALEKIKLYHLNRRDIVENCSPLESAKYDKVYASSLFDWTDKKYVSPEMVIGGTGFDLAIKLPLEIDAIEPHINLGFTMRGCPNKCKFCVVPRKEGDPKIVGDILTLWDGKAKLVTLYDNNILALPEHFAHNAEQARENHITLDYNQGLDHRKLTPEIVDILKSFSHSEYRFAFDHPQSIKTVERAIDLLQDKGINRCSWYVLCGYDTTMEEDLFRLNYLRSRNQIAYVQRFRSKKNDKDPRLIALARWVNQHHLFRGMTWEQFLDHPDNKGYKRKLCELKDLEASWN